MNFDNVIEWKELRQYQTFNKNHSHFQTSCNFLIHTPFKAKIKQHKHENFIKLQPNDLIQLKTLQKNDNELFVRFYKKKKYKFLKNEFIKH